MKIKKVFILLITGCLLACVFSGCSSMIQESESAKTETPIEQVSPLPESDVSEKVSVNLYFGYRSEQFLVCETADISMTINERTDITVLKRLIEGTNDTKATHTIVINPNTRIIDITESDGYLFVTLSKEFLDAPESFNNVGMGENTRRYLAVYSIINTLVEYGGYQRVQILIDRDDTGSGTPITNQECGLSGDEHFEPHGRNGALILDSKNTVKEILNSLEMKDWSRLYDFIAYKDETGTDRPTLDDFRNRVTADTIVLSDSEVLDEAWVTNMLKSTVFISMNIGIGDSEPQLKSNIPVKVIRENDMWKMTYTEFANVFINIM